MHLLWFPPAHGQRILSTLLWILFFLVHIYIIILENNSNRSIFFNTLFIIHTLLNFFIFSKDHRSYLPNQLYFLLLTITQVSKVNIRTFLPYKYVLSIGNFFHISIWKNCKYLVDIFKVCVCLPILITFLQTISQINTSLACYIVSVWYCNQNLLTYECKLSLLIFVSGWLGISQPHSVWLSPG